MEEKQNLKTCTICNRELPLTEFGNSSSRADGKSKYCKECLRQKGKEARIRQKEFRNRIKELEKEAQDRRIINYNILECSECGRLLLSDDFYKNKRNSNGFSKKCKECTKKHKSGTSCKKNELPNKYQEFEEEITQYRKNSIKYRLAKITAKTIIDGRISKHGINNNVSKQEYLKEIGTTFKKLMEEIRKDIVRYYEENYEYDCWCSNYNLKHEKEINNKKDMEYRKKRKEVDELYNFTVKVRTMVRNSFRRGEWKKNSRTQEIIGCSFEDLKKHLEKTWLENYGTEYNNEPVHIDHIIPLASAKTEEDIIKLCHWTNLQYLKPEDNFQKSDKLDWILKKK